jgi:hypothetical protein
MSIFVNSWYNYRIAINLENTMYVYIWKDITGIPFYVGFTRNKRRTNPRNSGDRNWLCKQKLHKIGVDRVIVELRPVFSIEEGTALECSLIAEYGRIQTENGPLTNLTSGGDGAHERSPEHKNKLQIAMLNPSHPIHSAKSRAKAKARMNDPDVKAKFLGEANAAKRPEVRAKIKAKWEDPEFRAARIEERTGVAKNFSEADLARRAKAVKENPAMKSWSERNGVDAEFDAKRIAGIKAAQPQRAEKMRDPVALAQRKERLKATMNSPEYKAKRAAFDTPEYRAKLSAAKKAYWDKKREA